MPISTKTDQTSLANPGGVVSAVLNINVRQSGNQEFQLFVLDSEFPQIIPPVEKTHPFCPKMSQICPKSPTEPGFLGRVQYETEKGLMIICV